MLAGDGTFKPVTVKSVHYKRLPVGRVSCQLSVLQGWGNPQQRSGTSRAYPRSMGPCCWLQATRTGRFVATRLSSSCRPSALLLRLHPVCTTRLGPYLQVVAGQTAALALKKVKRHQVRPPPLLPPGPPH